jgi:hypothetical protein
MFGSPTWIRTRDLRMNGASNACQAAARLSVRILSTFSTTA